MADVAELKINGKVYELPIVVGTENEVAIDISNLRAQSGVITLDPGDKNTGSTSSAITFLDGENGILRYRGYDIEALAEKSNFLEERSTRRIFRELSHRILLEVSHHRLRVKKAPHVGWLKILYPDQEDFALSFPEIQGLNSAWQWYEKGLHIPVLMEKIHPWYGCYFPTRFEHLDLFEKFLSQYQGPKESAFDVGVGSGILSLQLQKHGFKSISASDHNPNAIIGMKEELIRKQISNIKLLYGEFFVGSEELQDLIVFNPPWLPGSGNIEKLDTAIYYEEALFTEFFKQASQNIKPKGRVVLLFSNLAQITDPNLNHPIEEELAHGKRFEKVELLKKPDRKSTRLNFSHVKRSRMPSSA